MASRGECLWHGCQRSPAKGHCLHRNRQVQSASSPSAPRCGRGGWTCRTPRFTDQLPQSAISNCSFTASDRSWCQRDRPVGFLGLIEEKSPARRESPIPASASEDRKRLRCSQARALSIGQVEQICVRRRCDHRAPDLAHVGTFDGCNQADKSRQMWRRRAPVQSHPGPAPSASRLPVNPDPARAGHWPRRKRPGKRCGPVGRRHRGMQAIGELDEAPPGSKPRSSMPSSRR